MKNSEFVQNYLNKIETELDDFENQVVENKKKMEKLGNEKKKFASAKKFKDAGKC